MAAERDRREGPGQGAVLSRAVDKPGPPIDLYLSPTRTTKGAEGVLSTALKGLKEWEKPPVINPPKASPAPTSRHQSRPCEAQVATVHSYANLDDMTLEERTAHRRAQKVTCQRRKCTKA